MQVIKYEQVEDKIIKVRGYDVILDSDVAELYGIEVKRVNEAVKRNPDKFPKGYIINLTGNEWHEVKSQIATSPYTRQLGGGKVKLPSGFTEKGLYMLATILKSPIATQTTFAIIETFAKVREVGRTLNQLTLLPEGSEKQKSLAHRTGELLSELIQPTDLENKETESSIELNLAIVKLKHTIRKAK